MDPRSWVLDRLQQKERIMGFGHRVYKTLDPRAAILREMSGKLAEERGEKKWFDMSLTLMDVMETERAVSKRGLLFSLRLRYPRHTDGSLYSHFCHVSGNRLDSPSYGAMVR